VSRGGEEEREREKQGRDKEWEGERKIGKWANFS
jgi:hypothetical protein